MSNRIVLLVLIVVIKYLWVSSATSLSKESDTTDVIESEVFPFNTTAKGCQCFNYSCGCCEHMEESKIHLNATVCINATYLHEEYGISLTLTLNNFTIVNETVSARNPPPVCVGAPYVKEYAELCVRLYDLDVSRKKFHGCVDAEARLKKILIAEYELGCFDIGHFQSPQSTQENINNSFYVPSVTLI